MASVSGVGTAIYSYDPYGNPLSDGANSYTWDAQNRIKRVTPTNGRSTEFSYYAPCRRTYLTHKDGAGNKASVTLAWCGAAELTP